METRQVVEVLHADALAAGCVNRSFLTHPRDYLAILYLYLVSVWPKHKRN